MQQLPGDPRPPRGLQQIVPGVGRIAQVALRDHFTGQSTRKSILHGGGPARHCLQVALEMRACPNHRLANLVAKLIGAAIGIGDVHVDPGSPGQQNQRVPEAKLVTHLHKANCVAAGAAGKALEYLLVRTDVERRLVVRVERTEADILLAAARQGHSFPDDLDDAEQKGATADQHFRTRPRR